MCLIPRPIPFTILRAAFRRSDSDVLTGGSGAFAHRSRGVYRDVR